MKKLVTLLIVAALLSTGCAAMNEAQRKWNEQQNSQPAYSGFNPYLFNTGLYMWGASQNRVMPSRSITCTTSGIFTTCR